MITIRDLKVSFTKEYDALHDVNLVVLDGEKIAIVGDSDSGKTTLLRTLAGLQSYSEGEVLINNQLVQKINFKQDVSLGYVPKVPVFKNKKTVSENLRYVLKIRGFDQASMSFKVITALKMFGIDSLKNIPVENLTYHQKMLVQLARISMRKVDIVLIDNIAKNAIGEDKDKIIEGIKNLIELNPDTTFIMTTDSEKIAKDLGLKVVKIKLGTIID